MVSLCSLCSIDIYQDAEILTQGQNVLLEAE